MATIDELIASIEVEREAAQMRLNKSIAEGKAILALVAQEGRANTSEDEDARLVELKDNRDKAREALKGIEKRHADALQIKAEEAEAVRQAQEVKPTPAAQRTPATNREQRVHVGREERTYHRGNDPRGVQFVRDVVAATIFRDVTSSTRLSTHMHEEQVERAGQLYGIGQQQRAAGDTITSNWTGLVVPQYLTDLYAPATAALRPLADACTKHPLPADGMTVNISRVTTASSAALQTTELTAVSATSLDDTILSPAIQTIAGQQTVSRQAVERGTGITDVVIQDLFNRYATTLDSTLINQATTGLTNVATSVTYDDTTPTAAEAYPKILGAAAGVEAALLALGTPSHAVMHSRRWYWLSSQMSSTWPLINWQGIPVQAGGVANTGSSYASGVRGVLPSGLQVVVDNNIPVNLGTATTQDEIYVVPATECHLWEDSSAPTLIRAEQTAAASLGILIVVYGYMAYTFQRYTNGMQKVAGTGLTTPTF
jgi:hypothetical protein